MLPLRLLEQRPVTALAVLSSACAKNSTVKTKPKRQLDGIRTPQNLQYSLVLPHSRVAHFRSLTSSRRISHAPPKGGKLPPYAVQMEPVVQYSQKDPLYDPNLDHLDDTVVNKNEIYAQPKILNVQDQISESSFGPPYGSLPTAPLYSQEPHPQYYDAPEPIIEIIIKESNESLPSPPTPPVQKKKKEPVQVFYVKYSKDPHAKDKVIYEKPIPAITPPSNVEDDHHDAYITVTPEPLYIPPQTTTLRAIIKPESEVYHSDSSVKVTFGNEARHHSDRREGNSQSEDHEETAPRPAIALPQQQPNHPPYERSASSRPQYVEPTRPTPNQSPLQTYRSAAPHAQNRIQFQQPYLPNDQQLPRQGPSVSPFRVQSNIQRQNPFGPSPSLSSHISFSSGPSTPVNHFNHIGPTVPGPIGPAFPTVFSRPSNTPSFHPRPNNAPPFAPRPHLNGPPRTSFHSGPQRPFHQSQPQPYFDEAKYLQENYHTITTEQIEPPKDQLLPTRQSQNFNFVPKPSPSPTPSQFQDHHNRSPHVPLSQQLPQQRPAQQFVDTTHNKPTFSVGPSRSPFFNLKPSPPHIENNRPPFQQQPQQQPFSFHQGPQPSTQLPIQQNQHSFSGLVSASPSPIPQHQFLPQPSSPPIFNFHPQPSPTPAQQNYFQSPSDRPQFQQSHGPSERPQFQQSHGPSERPQFQQSHGPSERPQFQQSHGPSERPQFQQSHGPSERPQFQQSHGPSERPQFQSLHGPSERPQFQLSQGPSERPLINQHSNFQDQSNLHHQQNVGQFVPKDGQLVPSISKYEQHITLNGPDAEPDYSGLTNPQPTPTASSQLQQHEQQYRQQQQQQLHREQQQQQQEQQQKEYYDAEREQVRLQLAQNVQKQQEEIQRLQTQLLLAQQQQQHQQQAKQQEEIYRQQQSYRQEQIQASSPKPQYIEERSRPQPTYVSSTSSPPYYQSTPRTIEIKPTTQKYVSSTVNSISTTPETEKQEKMKKPAIVLPDEVPDDLRQQLLSSGILDNADISVLDYDKVGETPLDSLPPDQLANFFSAGGGQQIASSEHRPIIVKTNGDRIESRIDDVEDDQEIAASENVASYVAPPSQKQAVEMKVVHFDPKTKEGQNIAKDYVKEDATQLDPVALNDKKYNRYLPLKVSGNQFPVPDVLKGKKVTSVVVLAPVETEALNNNHTRTERAATDTLKGIKFVAGDSLQDLLKRPTKENFEKWLNIEKKIATDSQSVVLLVTGNDKPEEREIFMYDVSSGNVNKLSGELSNAFVEAAENNSLSKDIEKLAIEGEGTPENFNKDADNDEIAEGSENVPLLVDISGLSLDQQNTNQVSISSGYSKTKQGRSLRRH